MRATAESAYKPYIHVGAAKLASTKSHVTLQIQQKGDTAKYNKVYK